MFFSTHAEHETRVGALSGKLADAEDEVEAKRLRASRERLEEGYQHVYRAVKLEMDEITVRDAVLPAFIRPF